MGKTETDCCTRRYLKAYEWKSVDFNSDSREGRLLEVGFYGKVAAQIPVQWEPGI